uniref:Solute carrier family 2, facilitated glucose transporter member 10 n=1 Tax=Sinocyclocheilus anshuiensis TaxID=1608454 RepID=A0A671PPX4_9TELE
LGRSVLVLTIIASTLGGLVFGYELGIISGALPQLQAQFYLGCVQQEAVVSALLIGSLSASVIGGWHHYPNYKHLFFLALVVGRAIIGFAMSISSMSCCIFVSEMVAPELGITVGNLLAYALNYVLSGIQAGWRYMFGLAIIPSLMQLVSIGFLPQTTGTSESLVTEDDSQQSDRLAGEISNPCTCSVFDLFKTKDNMCRRTAIGLGLVLSQQFTGQPNVLFYAFTILFSVGFQSNASAVLASVGLGIVKVIATLLAMVCSDKVGRRSLLIGGCTVLAIGLILNGLLCILIQQNILHLLDVKHMIAFSVSFGPMTWLVLSEIFPKEVRGRAYSFINCFNVGANLIVTFSFLSITDVVGLSGIFFVYGVIGMAAVVLIYIVLPETKGKSLHIIDRELSQTRYENIFAVEFCNIFQRRHFSPGYQRVHLTSTKS